MFIKKVILVGAGHAHLYIMKRARLFLEKDIHLQLIDPGMFWYSGMATGVLGGMYSCEKDRIDAGALIQRNGGTYIQGNITGIDPKNRVLTLETHQEVGYDAVSFNIGSEVSTGDMEIATERIWPVKPISNLCLLREHLETRFQESGPGLKIVVIGGGATGCEVAANLAALARRYKAECKISILTSQEHLLSLHPLPASERVQKVLQEYEIDILTSTHVHKIDEGVLYTKEGQSLHFDLAVLATGLKPPALFKHSGLSVDDEGGLHVNQCLQSIDYNTIFGAGDCISYQGRSLPKLGVFGVREAPVLLKNLLSFLIGYPLMKYTPQEKYLSILNMGNGRGLALWDQWHWYGQSSLWLKDWIDRGFLRRYR